MVISKERFIGLLALFTLLGISLIEVLNNSKNGVLCVITVLSFNIFWGYGNKSKRSTYLLFNITFFTFLVSMLFFEWLDNETVLPGFRQSTIDLIVVYYCLSLICISIGVKLYELFSRQTPIGDGYGEDDQAVKKADDLSQYEIELKLIRIAYFVSYPFYILNLIEKTLYVRATSYYDLYTSYSSMMPYFLTKIGELNLILFALFLTNEYRKNELVFPVVLFIISSILSLGIGQRNIFVLNSMMLAVGIVFANKKSIKYCGVMLYTKKHVFIMILLLPIIISFLAFWGNYRQSVNADFSPVDSIKDFFVSQGGQAVFFANTVERSSEIWRQKIPYTFASIYNYFRNLFGLLDYSIYSKQYALEGNSLGVTQFYITSPTSLESGRGAGGCYLSELLYDWGIAGIVLGSTVLGVFLRKLSLSENGSLWKNAFILLMIRGIVYIPRASYFDWVSSSFNIWNVTIVIMLFGLANLIRKNGK